MIDDAEILWTAEGLAEHLAAVNQKDQSVAGLHGSGVEANVEIEDGESILTIRREIVLELHPSAGAEREAVDVTPLIADRQWISRAGLLWYNIADGEFRCQPCSADVLIEERRRYAKSGRNVLETADFDFGRQQILRVDLD